MKFPPYQCPRCGHETQRKDVISHHMYKRKGGCPAIKIPVVELTDEVKTHVLQNRVYTPPPPPPVVPLVQQVTNITNHNNQIINFIANLNVEDKLKEVMAYQKRKLVDFETSVEDRYQEQSEKMEKDAYKSLVCYTPSHYIDMVSSISCIPEGSGIDQMNIYYDPTLKVLKIYIDDKWKEYRIDEGVKYVVETLAISFLYSYECYLIRKLEDNSIIGRDRADIEDCLDKYYRFLFSVDVVPHVRKVIDNQEEEAVFGSVEVPAKYLKIYEKLNVNVREVTEIRKTIVEVFKRNSLKNINELNKTIHQLIKGNADFQQSILQLALS